MPFELNNDAIIPLRTSTAQPRLADPERLDKLKQACADLESIFINSLLKSLKQTIPENGLLPKSAGSGLYDSMMDGQLAVFLSQGQGLGLGQVLFQQMSARYVKDEGRTDPDQTLPEIGLIDQSPPPDEHLLNEKQAPNGLPLYPDSTDNK